MIIPSGYTSEETEAFKKLLGPESVAQTISHVQRAITKKFVFGFYSLEDIRQQAAIFCLEVLATDRYDPGGFDASGVPHRPLGNFLWTHARNRLLNMKRDQFMRNDPPCTACHRAGRCQQGQTFCEPYRVWKKRNGAKASLLSPVGMEREGQERDTHPPPSPAEDAVVHELSLRIDAKLPAADRADYLRLKDGLSLTPERKFRVELSVKSILFGAPCPSGLAS